MVNQVSHSTGADSGLAVGGSVSIAPIYGQLSSHHGEDSFHSSHGGNSEHKGGLISRFFGKIKEILSDVIALPGLMWRKFFGGGHGDDHGGHGGAHGPVKILADRGLLSGDMMDASIAGLGGENAFLARSGAMSGDQSYL